MFFDGCGRKEHLLNFFHDAKGELGLPASKQLRLAIIGALTVFVNPVQAEWREFDGGGRVGDYLDLVGSRNASGQGIEISGICASACTIKLGVKNACIYSSAQLWFHAARNDDQSVNILGTLMMMQEYPSRIRRWAKAHGALNSFQFTGMSGKEAIALGVRDCVQNDHPHRGNVSASGGTATRRELRQLPIGKAYYGMSDEPGRPKTSTSQTYAQHGR